jgi:hypothetical protein
MCNRAGTYGIYRIACARDRSQRFPGRFTWTAERNRKKLSASLNAPPPVGTVRECRHSSSYSEALTGTAFLK